MQVETQYELQCPHCGKRHTAPESWMGRIARCDACRHRFALEPAVVREDATAVRPTVENVVMAALADELAPSRPAAAAHAMPPQRTVLIRPTDAHPDKAVSGMTIVWAVVGLVSLAVIIPLISSSLMAWHAESSTAGLKDDIRFRFRLHCVVAIAWAPIAISTIRRKRFGWLMTRFCAITLCALTAFAGVFAIVQGDARGLAVIGFSIFCGWIVHLTSHRAAVALFGLRCASCRKASFKSRDFLCRKIVCPNRRCRNVESW